MKNLKIKSSILIALLSAMALSNCGGGSGGSKSPGGTAPVTKDVVNPIPNGFKAFNEVTSIYFGNELSKTSNNLKLDPKNGTFQYYIEDHLAYSGEFDAKIGKIKITKCEEISASYCRVGSEGPIFETNVNYLGGKYVRLSQPKGPDIYLKRPYYYATSFTHPADLPSGTVKFEGPGLLYTRNVDIKANLQDIRGDQGKAVTTVNFDKGTVDANFKDFGERLPGFTGEIKSAELKGNRFSGGSASFKFEGQDEVYSSENGRFDLFGAFYGPQGQELGAQLRLSGLGEGKPDIFGIWQGTKQ